MGINHTEGTETECFDEDLWAPRGGPPPLSMINNPTHHQPHNEVHIYANAHRGDPKMAHLHLWG